MKNISLSFFFIVLFVVILVVPVFCQVRPVNDYGELGLQQAIRRLNTTASVMMIGAHPDDEDSALLAYLARGESARTAYLSLTRGDGGQNIIGPELFEALGVIRTEELLQARRLDGAEQYFTRAFDYGFSKTLDEAKQKWPIDVVKCDMVRAIREFKPQVVVSVWSGTPNDGHGQHQYSGYISPIAVKAAADANQCTNAGPAWQVLKLYMERGISTEPTLRINVGKYDPLFGRSYFEIAMEGRSQHRSQGEGRLEVHGAQFSSLALADSKVPKVEKESSIFSGIDTQSPWGPVSFSVTLKDLLTLSSRIPEGSYARFKLTEAIAILGGLQIDVLSDKETVVAGESVGVGVKVYLNDAASAKVMSIDWNAPAGWNMSKVQAPADNSSAFARREIASYAEYYQANVPVTAEPTQPYWLKSPGQAAMFGWPTDSDADLPFQPPLITSRITVDFGGTPMTFERPVQYRFADPSRGEIRRELNVVPSVSVSVDHDVVISSISSPLQHQKLTVTVTNNKSGPIAGTARIGASTFDGVTVNLPKPQPFDLKAKGDKTNLSFEIPLGRGGEPHATELSIIAEADSKQFDRSLQVISYSHIQTHRMYSKAGTQIVRLDLGVAPVNVGYIMGSGDDVPEAIRQMGLNVTTIDDLSTADLSKYDSIVVGIRASEVRPDFAANNKKLLDWVRGGGNLIVQYQRPAFAEQNLAPFSMTMNDTQRTAAGSTSRVVDENAKVTILEPANPIFNFPNKITDADFEGWIQERDLYNWVTFDKQYTPLLESHDAGEQPNNGGMVLAQIGKGTYVYTSYSWFRQLPAGVPGAYRIFANLLSLPKAPKR